jgi:hypothetical protein
MIELIIVVLFVSSLVLAGVAIRLVDYKPRMRRNR